MNPNISLPLSVKDRSITLRERIPIGIPMPFVFHRGGNSFSALSPESLANHRQSHINPG